MKIENRVFYRNYQEVETFEVGIVLSGAEVKSIRSGALRLDDSFVKLYDDGAYLINAEVPIYKFSQQKTYNSREKRKLLLHKKELIRLRSKIQSSPSLTIAPISCYTKGRLIKLEVALAKGRTDLQKRKLEKARDVERNEKKEAKEFMKE
jgi:SsrA-binding protein